MTVETAGHAQLYLGTDPATRGEFWILDLTTSLSFVSQTVRRSTQTGDSHRSVQDRPDGTSNGCSGSAAGID